MIKFYILTSTSLNCLSRQFNTLSRDDSIVVINTLDKEYEERAAAWCTKNQIEYYITKSDGTAATGKNSVIDLFLESDNEYMVQIDGDDYITKYGVNLYRTLANKPNAPDILCLSNQISLGVYDKDAFIGQVDSKRVIKNFMPSKELFPEEPHNKHTDFTQDSFNNIVKQLELRYDIDDIAVASRLAQARIDIDIIAQRHAQHKETFNRIVFHSRKGASYIAYDNCLSIGEDTIQYYKLKRLAYDGLIDMKLFDENIGRTYIYMEDYDGVVSRRRVGLSQEEKKAQNEGRWLWLIPLRDELNKISRNLPINYQLSFIDEPQYETQ